MVWAKRLKGIFLSAGIAYLVLLAFLLYRLRLKEETLPLKLHAVTPAETRVGERLHVTLEGSGFTPETRACLLLDAGNRKQIIASVPTWGTLEGVAVRGTIAFLANQSRGVQALDVSDPKNPRFLGSIKPPGEAWAVVASGDLLYVGTRKEGIHVIQAADPTAMTLAGTVATGGNALRLKLKGNRLFVANSVLGLQVLDTTAPHRPRLLGTLKVPGAIYDLAIGADGLLYLAAAQGGVHVVESQNPHAPLLVASLPTPAHAYGIAVDGASGFVAAGDAGLLFLDLSTPRSPRIAGGAPTIGRARPIALASGRAYVGTQGGLQIFDLSTPHLPRSVGFIEIGGSGASVTVEGSRAYIAAAKGGLHIVDILTSGLPSAEISFSLPGKAISDMRVVGTKVVFAVGTEVVVAELVPPGQPRLQGRVPLPSADYRLAAEGDRLCAGGGRKLFLLKLSAGGDLVRDRALETEEEIRDLTVSEGVLYMAAGRGVSIVDLTSADPGGAMRRIPSPVPVTAVATRGEFLYAGTKEGIQVFRIHPGGLPRSVGSAALPWHMRNFSPLVKMIVDGERLYVAAGRNGLLLFDIRSPSRPRMLGSWQTPGFCNGVTVAGMTAYVSDSHTGLHVVDIRRPEAPVKMASVASQGTLGTASLGKSLLLDDTLLFTKGGTAVYMIPPPVELQNVSHFSGSRVTAVLAAPPLPGTYTLRVFSGAQGAELPGVLICRP